MTRDLDEAIRTVLDDLVATAPPVDPEAPAQRPERSTLAPRRHGRLVAVAAVALALAGTAALVATRLVTSSPASTPGAPTSPPTLSTPSSTSPPPTTPVDARPPIAFGDNVMVGGAATQLSAHGIIVDAQVSRQMQSIIPTVRELITDNRIGSDVVVHLGTNGPITTATLDEFFTLLADVPHVVVLTNHAERDYIAANNAAFKALPVRYPNVTVLDWDQLAGSCPGRCFHDDGIHLTPDGQTYYTQLIINALDPRPAGTTTTTTAYQLPPIGSDIDADDNAPWFRPDGSIDESALPDLIPFGSPDGIVIGYLTKKDFLTPRTTGTLPLYDEAGQRVGHVAEDGRGVVE